jgi:hypothetical protein
MGIKIYPPLRKRLNTEIWPVSCAPDIFMAYAVPVSCAKSIMLEIMVYYKISISSFFSTEIQSLPEFSFCFYIKSSNQQIIKSTNQQINKSTNQQINKSTNK